MFDRGRDRRLDLGGARHVALVKGGLAARLLDGLDRIFAGGDRVDHQHFCALARGGERRGAADAVRGAGYQCDFAVQ